MKPSIKTTSLAVAAFAALGLSLAVPSTASAGTGDAGLSNVHGTTSLGTKKFEPYMDGSMGTQRFDPWRDGAHGTRPNDPWTDGSHGTRPFDRWSDGA